MAGALSTLSAEVMGRRARVAAAVIALCAIAMLVVPAATLWLASPTARIVDAFSHLVRNRIYWTTLATTSRIAVLVGLGAAVWGWMLGCLGAAGHERVQRIVLTTAIVGLTTGAVVRSFAWYVLFADRGAVVGILPWLRRAHVSLLFTPLAVIAAMTVILMPWATIAILAFVRPWLYRERLLGDACGSPLPLFIRFVLVPRTSLLFVGTAFAMTLLAFGFYVTPQLIGGGQRGTIVLTVMIDQAINTFGDWASAAALSAFAVGAIILVLVTAGTIVALSNIVRRRM